MSFDGEKQFVRTWTWLLRSDELGVGQARAVRALGRDLVVYRTEGGEARALDARCPHMGAHLAEGHVEGEGLRCFFHGWKLGADGRVEDVPCLRRPPDARLRAHPVRERHGLIWLWPGEQPTHDVPTPRELVGRPVETRLGRAFDNRCHPHVVMINAIDEQHFATVHDLPAPIRFAIAQVGSRCQRFVNVAPIDRGSRVGRLIAPLYETGVVTYELSYWGGTNGAVTVGPDGLHCHIMFALRLTDDGGCEGQTVLLHERRPGVAGRIATRVGLFLAGRVADYFGRGDNRVFDTIRFDLRTPIKADRSVIAFMRFVDGQPSAYLGSWADAPTERRLRVAGGAR